MPSEAPASRGLAFLLDEHYPGWLASELRDDGLDVAALTHDRPHLRGAADDVVLHAAAQEGRVVVTEDVTTFAHAAALVPDHHGIIYCHPRRFPRTASGLQSLRRALLTLAREAPPRLGVEPVVMWLAIPDE